MKKKKLVRWSIVVLVLLAAVTAYCAAWPGREISDSAWVIVDGRAIDPKDNQRVLDMIQKPHIPSNPHSRGEHDPRDAYGAFTILDDERRYRIGFDRRIRIGTIIIHTEDSYSEPRYFYIPPWEMKVLDELLFDP